MKTTHQDVLRCIEDWSLRDVVQCTQVGGRTQLEYNGEKIVYPHWLALQKVNQIGATYTSEGQ